MTVRTGTDRSLRVVAHVGLFLGGLDVKTISPDAPAAAAPGQMVHFTGRAQGLQPLVDTEASVWEPGTLQVRAGTHSAGETAGARRSAGRDSWRNHVVPATLFLVGTLMLLWPLRAMGRRVPGPPLVTGAGVPLFVPLGAVALHAGTLACAWWPSDRAQAVLAAGAAGAAVGLLLMLSALRHLLRARGTSWEAS